MRVTPFPRPDARALPAAAMPCDPLLMASAAQGLAKGLIVFDARARILAWNDTARTAMSRHPGLTFVSEGPGAPLRMRSPAGALQARIEEAVQACAEAPTAAPIILRLGGGPGFRQMLLRLAACPGADGALVAGTLVDPGQLARGSGEVLADLFGIGLAASRVAESYLKVDSVKEAARMLDLSTNTVKTHLASVYEATGCNRQAQLVRLLMGLNEVRAR